MQFGRWPTTSSNEIYLKGRLKNCYIHGPCNKHLEQQHIKIYPQCTIYTSTSQIYWQILWMLFHINQWMEHHYFNIICHMLRIASCHRLPSSPISGCKPNPPPLNQGTLLSKFTQPQQNQDISHEAYTCHLVEKLKQTFPLSKIFPPIVVIWKLCFLYGVFLSKNRQELQVVVAWKDFLSRSERGKVGK